jgi:PKD repeat protein
LSFTANQVGQRTIRFTPSITSATSYNWDLGDGRISVVQSPLITYAQEGTYYVCLTTQDSCGTRTTCDSVVATNTIGLSDFQASGFNVYPNPAQGLLYLENPEQKAFTYQLFNTLGQLVLPPTPSQQEQTALEVGHLPRGVYLLQIQINESIYFQRLILN